MNIMLEKICHYVDQKDFRKRVPYKEGGMKILLTSSRGLIKISDGKQIKFEDHFSSSKNKIISCDTWVAMEDVTKEGATLFGKNSDRLPFDSQVLVYNEGKVWEESSLLKLEYVEIPQAKKTYATMGSSPYWCWGYEMGVNEMGVAIGNEAIYTKRYERERKRGLIGMDLIRLGLERSATALEALNVITDLLERYGQWGSATPTKEDEEGSYDNSFLIVDRDEAWILETSGRSWRAKRAENGKASISNVPILKKWDLNSGRDIKTDWLNLVSISGKMRQKRSSDLLSPKINLEGMMEIARDHRSIPGICMHRIPALSEWETVASMVVALPANGSIEVWWAAGKPCNSVYVPFFFGRVPEIVSTAGKAGRSVKNPSKVKQDSFSEDSYWWLLKERGNRELKKLEEEFIAGKDRVRDRGIYTENCLKKILGEIDAT
jgi:secernin